VISDLTKKAQEVFSENASTILTAGGVVGTVTTAVLSVRAGMKAQEMIREAEIEHVVEGDEQTMGMDTKEKVKLTWPLFVPPVVTGTATVSAIVFANRINAKNAAAWAAAYAASQKQRDEYRAKLEEKLGIKKSEQARAEMAEERTDGRRDVENKAEMIIVAGGAVLCYDSFSDRYVRTTAERIRQAEKKCKEAVQHMSEVSLGTFDRELGFDEVPYDDMLGWNLNNPPNITIDTILVNDEPCLCIDFVNLPFAEWKTEY
jgi:hypothetical protein